MGLYWIGSRESDICYDNNLFSGMIVLYGNKDNPYSLNNSIHKRVNNNCLTKEIESFIYNSIKSIVSLDENAKFYFYDSSWAYKMKSLKKFQERFICVNSEELVDVLENKYNFRRFIDDKTCVLDAVHLSGSECGYENICKLFYVENGTFVIQSHRSSGGEGTYYINEMNCEKVKAALDGSEKYIVTKYIENSVSVNINCLISQNDIILFQGSVQILKIEDDKVIYRGADYPCYLMLGDKTNKFEELCRNIAKKAQKIGYRGICGFDGIIHDDNIYITECNPRFQASTVVLNKALTENNYPTVQKLNIYAFNNENISDISKAADLLVNYSSYAFHNVFSQKFGNYIFESAENDSDICDIHSDGYNPCEKTDRGIYMFRIIVKENISCINPNGGISINEALVEPNIEMYNKICNNDILALKISLMMLGVKINPSARKWLEENGGIRPGNNNAVDLEMFNLIINAPLDIKYISLTPFSIRLDNEKLFLYYYDKKISEVTIYPLDPLSTKKTSRNVPYTTVAYLSTDRLRVHMTNECIFKNMHKSCRFCNIVPCEDPIDIEDIKEVVKDYIFNSPGATHFLVGGQSMGQEAGRKRIIEMVQAIREYEKKKNIYVMALPYDRETIAALAEAGMTELSCNIEIFDAELAKEYMPGKGEIPREKYYDVLSYARTLLPEKEAVRSMIILGLEKDETFISGVKRLAELGIQPIISIFRPLPNTPLAGLVAPSLKYVYDMYYKLEDICNSYGLHLGPACVHCQNNTLSLPY